MFQKREGNVQSALGISQHHTADTATLLFPGENNAQRQSTVDYEARVAPLTESARDLEVTSFPLLLEKVLIAGTETQKR